MPANVDGMVREGISAYRAGRKDEARALLLRAVEIDQYNEQAWLWLSAVVESVEEQRTCLENVLTINPNNERAKQGLTVLSQKSGGAKSAPSHADDVLASSSFTSVPTPPPANPFSADLDADDELPQGLGLAAPPPPTASSSASSTHRVNEPSSEEYDEWVSNLNLGGTPAAAALEAAQQFASTNFDEDEDDLPFGQDSLADDELFSSGPFSASETPLPRSASRTPPPAPASPKPPPVSSRSSDSFLDELAEDEDLLEDEDLFDDYDDSLLEKPEASEFFGFIPKEIRATRLPGTNERYPVLVLLAFLVLVALNIGAIALFVSRMVAS